LDTSGKAAGAEVAAIGAADEQLKELKESLSARDAALAARDAALAARDAKIEDLERLLAALTQQIAALAQQVEKLNEQLNRNSRNSNKPPSSDPPGAGGQGPSTKGKDESGGKRKRGGQPGHRGHRRELLPESQVDEVVDLFPPECESCWARLPEVLDPDAKRHQHTELPPIEPHTTEFRRHTVKCPGCGFKTCAAADLAAIPVSPFGPRLMSVIALLTGVYHLSRRQAVRLLADVLGVDISLGAVSTVEARVSEAVARPVEQAWEQVKDAPVKHTDGTGWLQASAAVALWTIATAAATVFKIIPNGRAQSLKPLFGVLKGILVSDRATALMFWTMARRQICWAHLLRKFVAFSERDGPCGRIGAELLEYTGILFEYWQDFRAGKLSRGTLQAWMAPLRSQVENLLEKGVAQEIEGLSGSCQDILEHRAALWTFLDHDDVEPTNNHAERELRAFVLWRKRCFGTQSDRGNLFAERLMTVAHTARKQQRNVLAFLTACCVAHADHEALPSLFGAEAMAA
jgi:transposase